MASHVVHSRPATHVRESAEKVRNRIRAERLTVGMQKVLVQFFQTPPRPKRSSASAARICREHRELLEAIRDRGRHHEDEIPANKQLMS